MGNCSYTSVVSVAGYNSIIEHLGPGSYYDSQCYDSVFHFLLFFYLYRVASKGCRWSAQWLVISDSPGMSPSMRWSVAEMWRKRCPLDESGSSTVEKIRGRANSQCCCLPRGQWGSHIRQKRHMTLGHEISLFSVHDILHSPSKLGSIWRCSC